MIFTMGALVLQSDDAAGRAALATCMARPGFTRADCEESVEAGLVGGRFCDGQFSLRLEALPAPSRCVSRAPLAGFDCCTPQEVLDRKAEAIKASPLPVKPQKTTTAVPWTAVAAGAAVLVIGAFVLSR